MKIETICRIEIEDENFNQMGNIQLLEYCEIYPKNIIVSNFEIIGIDQEALQIRFVEEDKLFDLYDVEETISELLDCIKIESELEDIISDDEYTQLQESIKQILIPHL